MDNNAGAAVVGPDYLFEYENVAETPACGMVFSSCTARVGRLARVGVERVYETFDWFEYDYAEDGRVIGEQYPDGREIEYDYESTEGRLVRRRFPELDGASAHNFTRWDYDTAANGQHSEAVTAIHHELSSGPSLFAWADEMLTDAAGRWE